MPRDPTRDVVRGLTSLEMTFVNISNLQWTNHSPYIGQITYADTIFPCFAFLSGMSPTPARRNVGLVGLGLGLNTVSSVINGKPVRIPGVLQRLGISSLIANEPHLAFLRRYHGVPLMILWYAITLLGASETTVDNPLANPEFPGADTLGTAQTRIDRLFFGHRLYRPSYDPEGLLGCLTTAASMVLGRSFQESNLTASEKVMASVGMISLGETLHIMLPKYAPISKSLWTPSFVLVTSGVSILKYLALERGSHFLPPAVHNLLLVVGKRPLEVYVISTLLTIIFRLGGQKSFMARSMRLIGSVTGPAVADFVMSMGLTGIVAASAQFMVSQNWRLHW